MKKVKILGSGCSKCLSLERKIIKLVQYNQLPVEVKKETDLDELVKYEIMMTPTLVIDGVIKSLGYIPKDEKLLEWLKES